MAKPIHPAVEEWFERYAEFARACGWLPMPMGQGTLRMYYGMRKRVKKLGEAWPSWEELEAGQKVTTTWGRGWCPSNPYWILAQKGEIDEPKYPNILALRNYARKAKTQTTTETPDTPRFSERFREC